MDEAKVKAVLREENEEFRRLDEKHHKYSDELDVMAGKTFLSPEELVRKKELKKRKLQLKDRMHDLILDSQKGV